MLAMIIIGLVALFVGFYIGCWYGIKQEKDNAWHKDPDNNSTLSDDDRAMLLFTKPQRYELGKAMVIGEKTEIENAQKALKEARLNITSVAMEAKYPIQSKKQ